MPGRLAFQTHLMGSTALFGNPTGELAFGVSNAIPRLPRRGARVVDRDGLENRCTFTGTVSSNLTLSASKLFFRE